MKVIITGGGGFLGSRLCTKLVEVGKLTGPSGVAEPIEQVVLLDSTFPDLEIAPLVSRQVCDIADRDAVFEAVGLDGNIAVFHLASMVSGECELRFDDALRVNLDGGRNVFEAVRRAANATRNTNGLPRLVFASSIACFGGDVVLDSFSDTSKQLPRTTYGMTKSICELFINDYSRKRFFDGRSARLPTVIVRPGKPNAAASSWASGMFREPLSGVDCLLPVHRYQCHPMTGYRTVIDSLIALHEIPEAKLGGDRAVGLPALQVTPNLASQVLGQIAAERGLQLGKFVDAFDPRIQSIVDGWATAIDGTRAIALGIPPPPTLNQIVQHYLMDFCTPI